jgi:hypothetical protein
MRAISDFCQTVFFDFGAISPPLFSLSSKVPTVEATEEQSATSATTTNKPQTPATTMKFIFASSLALFASVVLGNELMVNDIVHEESRGHHRMLNAQINPLPMMTFFIPLEEQSVYNDVFTKFGGSLSAPVVTMLSVTISTDKTVIWYDHWEDGLDIDSTSSNSLLRSRSTEIWGDGNAANGCAPHIPKINCTNINDLLIAGTSIVVQNDIPIPRDRIAQPTLYDGGDRLQASFPVAVTRASFPKNPGSLLAGAGTLDAGETDTHVLLLSLTP